MNYRGAAMNKYVVSVNNFTKDQEDNLIKYLTDNGAGWWHMIHNFWLISSNNSDVTKESIRDVITKGFNGTLIIIDITNSSDWAGYGQKKDFDWMKVNWDN